MILVLYRLHHEPHCSHPTNQGFRGLALGSLLIRCVTLGRVLKKINDVLNFLFLVK